MSVRPQHDRVTLRLTTFGGLLLERDDAIVTGASAQRRKLALLAYLAVAGERGASRDKLLGIFWPETDTERARHALSQTLSALRHGLKCDDLVLGTSDLRLNAAVIESDVGAFQAAITAGDANRAVTLYEGPFLDGVFLSDAPEFERWVETTRARLAEKALAALSNLAHADTARGDHAAAATWWMRAAVLDGPNARVTLGLMTSLAACGDTAGALRHARVYETLIAEELNAAPDGAVVALADRLRASATATQRAQHARGPRERCHNE